VLARNDLYDTSSTDIPISLRGEEKEGVLGPSEQMTLPVWIRTEHVGKASIAMLFGYKSDVCLDILNLCHD
jgi:hypothetical protein